LATVLLLKNVVCSCLTFECIPVWQPSIFSNSSQSHAIWSQHYQPFFVSWKITGPRWNLQAVSEFSASVYVLLQPWFTHFFVGACGSAIYF
jgi:hypothetical protein